MYIANKADHVPCCEYSGLSYKMRPGLQPKKTKVRRQQKVLSHCKLVLGSETASAVLIMCGKTCT